MTELSYSKKGMVSTLAQVIICLDSRAVALIKTLSTYLGSSAGEFGFTGQQDPCSTRFPHFLIQVFFPLHYTSFVYLLGKKYPPNTVPCSFWMMLLFSQAEPQISSFFLCSFQWGWSHSLSSQNRGWELIWGSRGAPGQVTLMLASSCRYKVQIVFCMWPCSGKRLCQNKGGSPVFAYKSTSSAVFAAQWHLFVVQWWMGPDHCFGACLPWGGASFLCL